MKNGQVNMYDLVGNKFIPGMPRVPCWLPFYIYFYECSWIKLLNFKLYLRKINLKMQLFDPESLNSFQRFHVLNLIWILKQRFVFWFEHWKMLRCKFQMQPFFGLLIKYSWELVSLLSKHDRFTSSLIYQKLEKISNISSNLAKKRLHFNGLKISCLP